MHSGAFARIAPALGRMGIPGRAPGWRRRSAPESRRLVLRSEVIGSLRACASSAAAQQEVRASPRRNIGLVIVSGTLLALAARRMRRIVPLALASLALAFSPARALAVCGDGVLQAGEVCDASAPNGDVACRGA